MLATTIPGITSSQKKRKGERYRKLGLVYSMGSYLGYIDTQRLNLREVKPTDKCHGATKHRWENGLMNLSSRSYCSTCSLDHYQPTGTALEKILQDIIALWNGIPTQHKQTCQKWLKRMNSIQENDSYKKSVTVRQTIIKSSHKSSILTLDGTIIHLPKYLLASLF